MVRAWYMDNTSGDQRSPHMQDPPKFINLEDLKTKTGVEYFKIDAENYSLDKTLQSLKVQRGYTYEDVCDISPETLPGYEEKLKIFFQEHLHQDEEIRLIVDGSGYFDVRDDTDAWIRIEVGKGDMIILPAGIYHRFTMDEKNYTKAVRLFIGDPVWTPHNRPSDDMPVRKEYLAKFQKSAQVQ